MLHGRHGGMILNGGSALKGPPRKRSYGPQFSDLGLRGGAVLPELAGNARAQIRRLQALPHAGELLPLFLQLLSSRPPSLSCGFCGTSNRR
jgi:hypothetical protein